MHLPIFAITFDCVNAVEAATFWSKVLSRPVDPGGSAGFASIGLQDRSGPSPQLMFNQVTEGKSTKNRIHLDLSTTELDHEVVRLIELGASKQAEFDEDGSRWVTLLDPEGNEFDVVAEAT